MKIATPVTRQQGFSLLEILVAFSILAFSLGILLKIFSGGANTAVIAEEYTAAVQIAEALMSTAGVEAPLQAGRTSGRENDKYHWLVEVTPSPFNPENIDVKTMTVSLFKIKVTVSWGDHNDDAGRQIELTTLKLVNKSNEAL